MLSEIDPDDCESDQVFGLADPGWISFSELASVRSRLGLPVEQDLHFRADTRLSGYAREARLTGWIVV